MAHAIITRLLDMTTGDPKVGIYVDAFGLLGIGLAR